MLKLWIGDRNDSDRYISDPDYYFGMYFDFKHLEDDFAKRVVIECSDVTEVINYVTLLLPTEELISPRELSSGAKNLLIMMYDKEDSICDMVWCGENCEHFVAEIAKVKDLELSTSRYFNPFDTGEYPDGVEILNTGKVVYSAEEFSPYLLSSNLFSKV